MRGEQLERGGVAAEQGAGDPHGGEESDGGGDRSGGGRGIGKELGFTTKRTKGTKGGEGAFVRQPIQQRMDTDEHGW